MKKLDCVGIGSMVVDHIFSTKRIIGPDEKVLVTSRQKCAGGVTLNHLAWASSLGVKTGIFGRQGDDEDGAFLRAELDRHGIDRNGIVLGDVPSSFSMLYVNDEGERAIYMFAGATASTGAAFIRDHGASVIRSSRFFSTEISQLPLDAVIEGLESARDAGVASFLDVDVPPQQAVEEMGIGSHEQIREAMSLATVLKTSRSVLSEWAGTTDAQELAKYCFDTFHGKKKRFTAVTDGSRGSVLYDGNNLVEKQANTVQVVDTIGAGDAFMGGLIAGVVRDYDIDRIAALANACGAACAAVTGAVPLLGESRDCVASLLNEEIA